MGLIGTVVGAVTGLVIAQVFDRWRLIDLAEEIFEAPVRLGQPTNVGGLQDIVRNPMYATGVGLVLFGFSQRAENGHRFRIRDDSIFGRVKQRMRDWFYTDGD